MEQAALRLTDTGAVRHGSECFNYYFPQEIDGCFLLISDSLDQPIPWKYVGVQELQSILSDKISEGFMFPLNPKWVLCDPDWKKLYDELMASTALYADLQRCVVSSLFGNSRAISKNHPNGFQRQRGRISMEPIDPSATTAMREMASPLRHSLNQGMEMSWNAACDLAQIELETYTSKKMKLAKQIQFANSMGDFPDAEELKDALSNGRWESDDNSDSEDGSAIFPISKKNSHKSSRGTLFRMQREEERIPTAGSEESSRAMHSML